MASEKARKAAFGGPLLDLFSFAKQPAAGHHVKPRSNSVERVKVPKDEGRRRSSSFDCASSRRLILRPADRRPRSERRHALPEGRRARPQQARSVCAGRVGIHA